MSETSSINFDFGGDTFSQTFEPIVFTGTVSSIGTITFNQSIASTNFTFGLTNVGVSSTQDGDWSTGNSWNFGYKLLEYPVEAFEVLISTPDAGNEIEYVYAAYTDINTSFNFGPNNGSVTLPSFVWKNTKFGLSDTVTINLDASYAVTIKNVITFSQGSATVSTVKIVDDLIFTGGHLTVTGSLTNEGTLNILASSLGVGSEIINSNKGSIVIGDGAVVNDAIQNNGLLQCTSTSGSIYGSLTNAGLVEANSAGDLSLEGRIVNTGTILSTGTNSTINIYGSQEHLNNKSTIAAELFGSIDIAGDVSGGDLMAASDGVINITGGVLSDVTFSGDGTGSFLFNGGTLNNTTNQDQLLQEGSGSLSGSFDNEGFFGVVQGGGLDIIGTVSLSGNGTFAPIGAIYGGTLININNTLVAGEYGGPAGGKVSASVVNEANGVIEATTYPGGSILSFVGSLTNAGLVEANSAGDLSLEGSIVNTGTILSTGTNSTIEIGGYLSNEGILAVGNSGQLIIENAAINTNTILDDSNMTFISSLTNDGTIDNGGDSNLSLNGQISGIGSISLGANSSLNFDSGVSTGQLVDMYGGADIVTINDFAGFFGSFSNFEHGDEIGIQNFNCQSFMFSKGKLTLFGSSGASLTIGFIGNLSKNNFLISSNEIGGTSIAHS